MSAPEELDREYEERLAGWAERLERQGWLRLGRGTVLELTYDLTRGARAWRWRTAAESAGEADTPRDAVAAALHALGVDL